MKHLDIFKKLLPPGKAFSSENKEFHSILEQLATIFDESKDFLESLFSELPGSLNSILPVWCDLFDIDDKDLNSDDLERINQEIIERLTAQGGQSKEYLEKQLSYYLKKDESLQLDYCPEKLCFYVQGINKVTRLKSGMKCNKKLTSYKRNGSLIKRFKEIRHAEIEARYLYGSN